LIHIGTHVRQRYKEKAGAAEIFTHKSFSPRRENLLARRDKQTVLVRVVVPATSKCFTTLCLGVVLDTGLKLGAEVTDQTLDGPGKGLTQSADGVALDLLGELLHHVDFTSAGLALLETVHDLLSPLGTLTARSALTARLVVVEL
jgi:hypothetical protein